MYRLSGNKQRKHEGKISIRDRSAALILLLLLLSSLATGCGSAPQAAAALPTATAQASATAAPTRRPPVVSAIAPTPTGLPSFAPLAAVTAAATLSPTATLAATATVSRAVTVAATMTATATLAPTFTPPAIPKASPHEHYWFQRPVAQDGVVWTDKYYPYGSTRSGQLRTHHGVEFNVPYNTEILAVGPGTVVVAGNDSENAYGPQTNFYGNLVIIRHEFQHNGQPVFSLYGHLNETLVSVGQQITVQEVIGLSGATGVADGPHMHLEVRVGENAYTHTRNPLLWLYPFSGRGTVAGIVRWPDGSPATDAPVSLNRLDGTAPYAATTTYATDSVNADPGWNENFVLDDVRAGYYQVVVKAGSKEQKVETWVYAGRTSFVEIILE